MMTPNDVMDMKNEMDKWDLEKGMTIEAMQFVDDIIDDVALALQKNESPLETLNTKYEPQDIERAKTIVQKYHYTVKC